MWVLLALSFFSPCVHRRLSWIGTGFERFHLEQPDEALSYHEGKLIISSHLQFIHAPGEETRMRAWKDFDFYFHFCNLNQSISVERSMWTALWIKLSPNGLASFDDQNSLTSIMCSFSLKCWQFFWKLIKTFQLWLVGFQMPEDPRAPEKM